MTEPSNSSPPLFTHPFSPQSGQIQWASNVELADRRVSVAGTDTFHDHVRRRRSKDRAIIENPLAHLTDEELVEDVTRFARAHLPNVKVEDLLRAARVAKNIRTYDEVARKTDPDAGRDLPVILEDFEKQALKAERDQLLEKGMLIVILTVSLAAFLQGHVQSSINGSVPYLNCVFKLNTTSGQCTANSTAIGDWELGAVNASPFLFAAAVGCPLAPPINDLLGRKGAMAVAASLIFATSLAAPFATTWAQLFGVRIVNGVGMGIKAVSTPILASETAVGFWRGSSILVWQLWVAFGIMIGFAANLIFLSAKNDTLTGQLILGAPFVPALVLFVGLYFCPESPRYYMRPGSLRYNPAKAYEILKRLRKTELQALRDLYLMSKSIKPNPNQRISEVGHHEPSNFQGPLDRLDGYRIQFVDLFQIRRLRNALISSSTVNLAQQLCGINVLAFYSTSLFLKNQPASDTKNPKNAMGISFAFGAINFLFALPAIRTIDTLGRRKWLTITLPLMVILMTAAAASSASNVDNIKTYVVVMWLLLFAAAYSPGLGPIPFTLASESFPLSHREVGCAFAIAVNLGWAGILSLTFPALLNSRASIRLVLGIFAGLNFVAFLLVFTLVEETKRRSLEDLDQVFDVSKRKHVSYQLGTYLPWFVRYYFLGRRDEKKPTLYEDLIWGHSVDNSIHLPSIAEVHRDSIQPVGNDAATGATEDDRKTIDSDHR